MGSSEEGRKRVEGLRVGRCARLMLLATVAGLACVGPAQEQFARIEPGQTTRQEVLELLGEPAVSTPERVVYLGGDGRQAVVRFDEYGVVIGADWWPPPAPPAETPGAGGPAEE